MKDARSSQINERPGVTSSYTVESIYLGYENALPVGLVVPAAANNDGTPYEASSLSALREWFTPESARLLSAADILLQNGVAKLFVAAIPMEDAQQQDYQTAIDRLCDKGDVRIVVCDSQSQEVLTYLKERIHTDSEGQREKIALCAQSDADMALSLAASLESERMMVCAGNGTVGEESDGFFTACAMAGILATTTDPSANLNGSAMIGISGLENEYPESDIQRMLSGGVTPFETVGETVECVKPVSTRTHTDGISDRTWHSIGTVMTIDYVMRRMRELMKLRLKGAKNNLATRESIRSQVALELSNLCDSGILDDFGRPTVYKSESDPGVCVVELSFKVSGVLDQIHVTAHITV